jgi:hypothetical protein
LIKARIWAPVGSVAHLAACDGVGVGDFVVGGVVVGIVAVGYAYVGMVVG